MGAPGEVPKLTGAARRGRGDVRWTVFLFRLRLWSSGEARAADHRAPVSGLSSVCPVDRTVRCARARVDGALESSEEGERMCRCVRIMISHSKRCVEA